MNTVLKIFYSGLTAILVISCGGNTGKFETEISGTVEQVIPDGFVKFEIIGEKGTEPIDTVEINSNGTFKLFAEISEPSFYRLNFNDRQYVVLILTGRDTQIKVNANGYEPNGYSEVSGSHDTQYMRDIDILMKSFQVDVQRINQQAIQARTAGDLDAFRALNLEYQDLTRNNNNKLKELIWDAVPSLAALYGIQRLDPEANFSFFDSVSMELSQELPNNPIVKNLATMVEGKSSLSIGAEAPELALPDRDGEIVRLSSLRGNYVLIDFWAAWCKPCRVENPNVVRMYNAYSDRNFEILGVSLDRTRTAWLKAIEQDGLPWQHVSDLKYWNSDAARTYQVNAIPATYLIDPGGKIIAKNLRGENLEAKLKEIF